MHYRKAKPEDIPAMTTLILEEGPNKWNFLSEKETREHLDGIADGRTEAVVVKENGQIVGFVSYVTGKIYPQYEPEEVKGEDHAYISEAVVHRGYRGRGLGTQLLDKATDNLMRKGYWRIYAHRHEENKASERLMEKSDFVIVDTFDDPEHRPHGSRRTTVCRYFPL